MARPFLRLVWVVLVAGAGAGCLVTNTVLEVDRDCTGQCTVRPVDLKGARQPGERCTFAQECLPVCCACGGDSQDTVLLASCRLGSCMKRDDICGLDNVGALCGQKREGLICAADAGR